MSKGKCIIFSAPSGSGKTTLVNYLLDQNDLNLIFLFLPQLEKRERMREKMWIIFI